LFIVLVVAAVWAILDQVLIPSTRWFLRRRINRVIDEISIRLDIKIKPFQITKRQVLIDRLVYDPKPSRKPPPNANVRAKLSRPK